MLFSLNYKSKIKQQADEIKCPVNQLGLLFPFIKDNPNKRYNITIADKSIDYDKIVEQVELVKSVTDNYTIECGSLVMLRALLDTGYNAYSKFPVADWETFSYLKNLGVSDIYIDGPLGFQCDLLKRVKDVKIRVSPTVSANAAINLTRNAKSFFIRPEDLSLYEDAIDIIDFQVTNDQEKEKALFNIYKRGTFNYDLNDLIENLHIKVNNIFINPDFGKERVNCQQRCMRPDSRCNLCETQLVLTNTLIDYLKMSN